MRERILFIFALVLVLPAEGARLKDLASIRGVRSNQLWGYGIVVGLAGTGDSRHELTQSSLYMALQSLGVDLKAKEFQTKNTAAVVVHAVLRPFMSQGGKMDVSVSSIGSATSLEGGTLMMTPLKGPDDKVYAISQGKVITSMRTGRGTKFLRQSLVSAQVPGGAILEREVPVNLGDMRKIRYTLNAPDFTTASRTVKRINEELGARIAVAVDAGTVDLNLPEGFTESPVELVARIENISINADQKARVVINQRTGTVIMGQNVEVSPASIAHNNLRVEIKNQPPVGAAPQEGNPPERELSSTPTAIDIDNPSATGSVLPVSGGTQVADVVNSLNNLGASPDDLILILQSLKTAGALNAEIITR